MATQKCKCSGAVKAAIGIGALAVLAIVATITIARGRREPRPAAPEPEDRLMTPEDVKARVGEMIRERAGDAEYMEKLNAIARRYAELDALKDEAAREFAEWRRGFLASNETARALAVEIARLAATPGGTSSVASASAAGTEADPPASAEDEAGKLRAELKALCEADPRGAYLLGKIDRIEEAYEAARASASAAIGSRVREQVLARAAGEKAAADSDFRARVKMGLGPKPVTNRLEKATGVQPAPRGENWWTNNPAPPRPMPPHSATNAAAATPAGTGN